MRQICEEDINEAAVELIEQTAKKLRSEQVGRFRNVTLQASFVFLNLFHVTVTELGFVWICDLMDISSIPDSQFFACQVQV